MFLFENSTLCVYVGVCVAHRGFIQDPYKYIERAIYSICLAIFVIYQSIEEEEIRDKPQTINGHNIGGNGQHLIDLADNKSKQTCKHEHKRNK